MSHPLNRLLAGHGVTVTEFQLMLILKEEGPSRTLGLARRLRLDPGPTGRALVRLEERELVRRPTRWRFSEWVLEPAGAMQLELLEPGWIHLNSELKWKLGEHLSPALVRIVDNLPNPLPREHQGWFD